jgi:GDP-L-fucose synthase
VNLYGPGDNFDLKTSHVIPAMIRKFMEAQGAVELWGDGTPTREFLYVRDCAEGILRATESFEGANPINLGSGQEISMAALADTIKRLTGSTAAIKWNSDYPNGQPRRMLDTSKAELAFGWRAATSTEAGLKQTIAWYQAHRAEARR